MIDPEIIGPDAEATDSGRGGVVAVTGVSGALGGEIAQRLSARGVPQLLVGRRPDALPHLAGAEHRGPAAYHDVAAMQSALTGADTLVLISSHPTGRRLEEHASAISAARDAGVSRVIYTSLVGAAATATYRNARDHWLTERFLADSGLRHTVVRAGFYIATPVALADDDLVVRGPAEHGKAAFVTHGDIAEVIATLAATPDDTQFDDNILEVTGPEAMTLAEALTRIAQRTGRPYKFQTESLHNAFVRRWHAGQEGEAIESWLSWFQAIEVGDLSNVTDVVERVTGRAAADATAHDDWPEPGSAFHR